MKLLNHAMGATALAGAVLASPVAAQQAQGLTIDTIGDVLGNHAAGLERSVNADDEVFFTARMTGADQGEYAIVAVPFDCTGAVPRCMGVTLYANFTLGRTPNADMLAKLLHYNDRHRLGRSYTFGQSAGVDYAVLLGHGAGEEYLAAQIARFGQVLVDFTAYMRN